MSYGTIQLNPSTNKWIIDAAPHVRARLRRFFESAKNSSGNLIRIDNTPAAARDLEWFLERYPLTAEPQHRKILQYSANVQRVKEEETAAVMTGRVKFPPLPLTTPLRAYQEQALDLLRVNGGLMCADEMGLGKTAVGAAAAVFQRPALIVCNTHTVIQWKNQMRKFAANARVVVAPTTKPEDLGNYDALIIPYSKIVGWRDALAGAVQTIIFDEMQELRHMDTAKYAASSHIAESCSIRLGLTGTPIYNYGGEIFSTMEILRPGELGTLDEFHREWCTPMGNGKYAVNDPAALRAFMLDSGMMIRRTRDDVGRQLPPITKVQHRVPYNKAVLAALKEEHMQLARTILSQSASFNDKGVAARELDLRLRQATGIAKAPFVGEMLVDLAKEGQKIVVGAWHREVYDILLGILSRAGIPAFMYTGSENSARKAMNVEAFISQQGGAVFLMSNRSGAGLDGLQHVASTVVYAELDWSPQVHDQLTARVARDGQQNGCTVIYCTVDAGSDPIVAGVLGIKTEQHLGIVDGISSAGTVDAQAEQSRIAKLAADFLERVKNGED